MVVYLLTAPSTVSAAMPQQASHPDHAYLGHREETHSIAPMSTHAAHGLGRQAHDHATTGIVVR